MKKVLILSDSFLPINVSTVKEVFKKISNDKVEIVDYYNNDVINSGKNSFKIPSIVRLKHSPNLTRSKRTYQSFSKRNVWLRDDKRCQYCGVDITMPQNHWDHVIPRSHGGKTNWTNIVSCCKKCNSKKGNKSLKESGLKLLKKPIAPYSSSSLYESIRERLKKQIVNIPHDSWKSFIYWEV